MTAVKLAGRVAVVTGAARGIGEAIARRLAREGAAVVVAGIDEAEAEAREVAGAIAATGGTAMAVRVDIADERSVAALAATVEAAHGRCEILVNNAAILDTTGIENLTMARYRRILDVNQGGAVRVTLALLPLLKHGGEGRRILNIASIMGVRGSRSSIPYSTAKGAVVNLTRALACDLGSLGITANALAPGFIDTRMALLPDGSGHEHETDWFKDICLKHRRIPLGRAGMPDEVAGGACFLCPDDARYVTGQVLLVDGGVSATF